MAATPLRAVRVADWLWSAASDVALARGESLSDVIRMALVEYAANTVEVFSAGDGPVHLRDEALTSRLAWCGVKILPRHWQRPAPIDEVTCPKCLTQLRRGKPAARTH